MLSPSDIPLLPVASALDERGSSNDVPGLGELGLIMLGLGGGGGGDPRLPCRARRAAGVGV